MKDNAFRVLGLNANASRKMVREAHQSLRIRARAGGLNTITDPLAFLNRIERHEAMIRDAFNRLENPAARVRERICWFEERTETDRVALDQLKNRQLDAALACWQADETLSSKTNLARLYYWLCREDPRAEDLARWQQAFSAWQHVLLNDDFWDYLIEFELDSDFDPPATVNDIRLLKEEIWQLVFADSIEQLRRALAEDSLATARRHLNLLRNSGAPAVVLRRLESSLFERQELEIEKVSIEIIETLTRSIERLAKDSRPLETKRRACDQAYQSYRSDLLSRLTKLAQLAGDETEPLRRAQELAINCLRKIARAYLDEAESFASYRKLLQEATALLPESILAERIDEEFRSVSKRVAEAYFKLGNKQCEVEKFNDAIDSYKQAVEIDPEFIPAQLKLAAIYRKTGHYREAINVYKQTIQLAPQEFEAHFNLGLLNAHLNRYQEAIEAYQQATRLKPEDPELLYNLGLAYSEMNQHQQAIETYQSALSAQPKYPEASYNLAISYTKIGADTAAIDAYRYALQLTPDNFKASYNLAMLLEAAGRFDEALQAYQQAVRHKSNYSEAYFRMGVCYQQLAEPENAINAFQQAIRFKPGDAEAHCCLGEVYRKSSRFPEAAHTLKQALLINPDYPQAYYQQGLIHQQLDQLSEAARCFRKALQLKPDYTEAQQQFDALKSPNILPNSSNSLPTDRIPSIDQSGSESHERDATQQSDLDDKLSAEQWYQLGLEHSSNARIDAAQQAFRRAIALKPNHIGALANLGVLYSRANRYQEALDCYQQLARLNPADADTRYNLAITFSRAGLYQQALAELNEVIKLNRFHKNAFFAQGVAYSKLKQHDNAINAYQKAIAVAPENANIFYNLAIIYRNREQYQPAIEQLKQVVQLKPDHVECYYNLGLCYRQQSRHQEALQALKQAVKLKPDHREAQQLLTEVKAEIASLQNAFEESPLFNNLFNRPAPASADASADARKRSTVKTGSAQSSTSTTQPSSHTRELQDCQQKVKAAPNNAGAHYNLGVAYSRAGQFHDAIGAYKEAILLKPDYARAYFALGVAYSKLMMDQEAIGAYKLAIELQPDDFNAYYNIGAAYRRSNRFQEAINAYQTAIARKPADAAAHYNLGQVYANLRFYRQAIEQFQLAIEFNANFARALLELGLAYLAIKDCESARNACINLQRLDQALADELRRAIDDFAVIDGEIDDELDI